MKTSLLACTALAVLAAAAAAPICTEKQKDAYYLGDHDFCALQTLDFQVCDDRCLQSLQTLSAVAGDCVFSEYFTWTLASRAREQVTLCTQLRANTTTTAGKYVPRATAGLQVCTEALTDPWDKTYGFRSPPHAACRDLTYENGTSCTTECLAKLRETVVKAPMCMEGSGLGFWTGERSKMFLQRCLVSRGESIPDDPAMQTQATSNSKLEATTVTLTTTTAPSGTTAPGNASTNSAETTVVSVAALGTSLAIALLL